MRVKSSMRQLHAGGVRHREQVQHGVGRAAERDDHGDGVLERLARHDVARPDARARSASRTAAPARRQSSRLVVARSAACAELLGRLMPSASIARAMVLAVYMPPHEPGAGDGVLLRDRASSASVILPAACWPTASNTETMSTACRSRRARAGSCRRRRTRRAIQPRHRHHAAGHVLVAAADRDEAVEALAAASPSRSSRRSLRATRASTSCPRCPSRCRRRW